MIPRHLSKTCIEQLTICKSQQRPLFVECLPTVYDVVSPTITLIILFLKSTPNTVCSVADHIV